MKSIPQRTCMSCRTKTNKTELIRIVCNKEVQINIDKQGKMEGRGAYICNNINCLEKAIKSKSLERAFKMQIDDEIYNKLRGVIIE